MSRILVPDSGPLFSLAAGNLLHLLARFQVGLADIVREETIDRGLLPNASIEAQRLLTYYNANSGNIQTFKTQVGTTIKAKRSVDPNYLIPRNVGELSIQSLLIDLQLNGDGEAPVVLFEDVWFINNAQGLSKPCIFLSTQAFLEYAESNGWIKSADQARQAISQSRPMAYKATAIIHQGLGS
ncbi:MAG: hypothetical protein HHJ12_01660 [Glaciimonas sp.]|nr:hypothetical protein [Glaciimonas sp.]